METGIDRATLDRLIALGRRQGGLTTDDLRRTLPVDGMSADAIALVVIELEDAGVPVELDDGLLASGRGVPTVPAPEAPVPPRPADPPVAAPSAPDGPGPATPGAAASAGSPRDAGRAGAHRAVVVAGLAAAVLALALVLILR
ncbi:MAG: hypothetical protein PGN34_00880 [Methylobacterium frigidaeris]